MLRSGDFTLSVYHVDAQHSMARFVPSKIFCLRRDSANPSYPIMKAPTSRRPNGFTLVELLVVIVIIAALASLGISGGLRALEKAKRTTSMAAARGIESAVNNFFSEYGSMPSDLTADTTLITNATAGATFLNMLVGVETTTTKLNTRGIKFLSITEGKNDANGIIYNADGTVKGMYDPWGGPYHVMLDLNYDEKVAPDTAAEAAITLNGRRVAVWSNGADNTTGVSGLGKAEDDVKTW